MLIVLDTDKKSIVAKINTSATTEPTFVSSYYDSYETTIDELSDNGELNGSSYVTIVESPLAGVRRVVKEIVVYNADNIDHILSIYLDDNGTKRILWKGLLTTSGTKILTKTENVYIEYYNSEVFWEEDGEDSIKPINNKTINADYLIETLSGGLFQP